MKWISVKDQMPKPNGEYLICCKDLNGFWILDLGFYNNNSWYFKDNCFDVIAWMPLPSPPKDES